LIQKEEVLDKKSESLEHKDDKLIKKLKELDNRELEINDLYQKEVEKLEELSGLTSEQARQLILSNVEKQTKYEAAMMIKVRLKQVRLEYVDTSLIKF